MGARRLMRAFRSEEAVTSDEQKRVQAVLRAALRRDPEERNAFLDEACAGSPWLRAEAAALLAAHHTAGDSFQASALE